MQSASATLIAACIAHGQRPCIYVEFSWDLTGSILGARGSAGWVNETSWLKADEADLKINPPGERLVPAGDIGQARLTMDNTTVRYSWRRTDSALYAYIGEANRPIGPVGVPVRIWRGYITSAGAEYICVFTGVVKEWGERPDATVAFILRDWGFAYLQNRLSRAVAEKQLPSVWIAAVATAAGMAANEMSLDVGVLPIPYTWMDDEFANDEIWTAAEADGGLALYSQRGILQYWNPLHWIGQASVWTFNQDNYTLPEPETNPENVATEVTVEYSPRVEAPDTDLYVLDELKIVMPGASETWVARFDYAALQVYDPDPDNPFNDYYVVSAGGVALNDDITITLSNVYGQQCTVTVANASTTQAARVEWLRIRGRPLVGGPTDEVTETVTPSLMPFPRQRALRSNSGAGRSAWSTHVQGNVYLQTPEQAQSLAGMLAVRCRRVRTIWTLQKVWGVPQLELGDRVTFYDTRSLGNGEAVEGLVIGISWGKEKGSGYIQTLKLMDVTDLADYDNYFIIGTNTLGGPFLEGDPELNYGRAWY